MAFQLSEAHEHWIENACRKFGLPPTGETKKAYLRRLILENEGRCAWSKIPLFFEAEHRTATPESGCHPFSASLDHTQPDSDEAGHEIVCYILNDIKGRLPARCFRGLQQTDAWHDLMRRLYAQWEKDPQGIDSIQQLLV